MALCTFWVSTFVATERSEISVPHTLQDGTKGKVVLIKLPVERAADGTYLGTAYTPWFQAENSRSSYVLIREEAARFFEQNKDLIDHLDQPFIHRIVPRHYGEVDKKEIQSNQALRAAGVISLLALGAAAIKYRKEIKKRLGELIDEARYGKEELARRKKWAVLRQKNKAMPAQIQQK